VQILRTPEEVTGYREVRYPKMDRARQKAEELFSQSRTPAPALVGAA